MFVLVGSSKMRLLMVAIALGLTGCASSTALKPGDGLQVVEASALPAPSPDDLRVGYRDYLIGPTDRLRVEVFNVPELTREVRADASGRISYPLIGQLDAAGRTPIELAEMIESGLRGRYVKDPQVTVSLVEATSQTVTVDGQVGRPGVYPVRQNMTLMRTVAEAGGLGEFAQARHVVVFRTVGGQRLAALHDLQAIRQGAYGDPAIYANDVVVVGESQARRIFRDVLQASGLLTAPLVAVLQNN